MIVAVDAPGSSLTKCVWVSRAQKAAIARSKYDALWWELASPFAVQDRRFHLSRGHLTLRGCVREIGSLS
jgi:hypothetical protein